MHSPSAVSKWLLAPLLDLIHGDIVLGDVCCRRIASALIREREAELQHLVQSPQLMMPRSVQLAIEYYCVRSYLLTEPQLPHTSPVVSRQLMLLAGTLRQMMQHPEAAPAHADDALTYQALLASAASALVTSTTALVAQYSDAAFADLMGALGEAVLGYLVHGTQECEQQVEAYLAGASALSGAVGDGALRELLQRFVESATAHRRARRLALEAQKEAEVQQLLFGQPSPPAEAESAESGQASEAHAVVAAPPAAADAAVDFAQEVHAAMDDAAPQQQQPTKKTVVRQPSPQQPPPPPPPKGRRLRSADDSLEEQILALEPATPPPTSQQQQQQSVSSPISVSSSATPTPVSSVSPVIVVDPSTMTVEMSTVVSASPLQHGQEEEGSSSPARGLQPPPPKRPRADPVLIGASETSVLRMLESSDRANGALPPPALSDASTVPLGEQVQEVIGGTPTPTPVANAEVAQEEAETVQESVRRCLRCQDAESRSYYLSPSTNRFEPYVARGFF